MKAQSYLNIIEAPTALAGHWAILQASKKTSDKAMIALGVRLLAGA